jgi:subtilisin family serine protease
MFEAQELINADTAMNFCSEDDMITRAVNRLTDAGFQILDANRLMINIAGTPTAYRRAFNTDIIAEERPVIKEAAVETMATFLECPDTPIPGLIDTKNTRFADVLEGLAIEEPQYFMAPSAFAPTEPYWHLRVPGDVSLGANADRAHRAGITGRGVKVVMVDSGWYKHPHFVKRGYRAGPVVLGPAAANPLKDESGHGTGESANIFAVAPDVDFQMVKINFVNSIGAFNAAVALNPDIITCSWGSSNRNGPLSAANQALAAAVSAAVASGITVVFSAGNGHWGFPGQHPDVISAGGVFVDQDESLRASDYASGFMSNIYPNRRVPDVSGMVGMRPRAIYIMLPLEPGDNIDNGNAGGVHPNGDETATNDGWAAFSGTSAAAPQLAGAAALIKQACPSLSPAAVKDILRKTARDVTQGSCSPSTGANPATIGPDTATGDGLVDAHKAAMVAKVRCLGPILPPIQPITPIQPPIQPIRPPIQPITPIQPPIQPIRPITPIQPGPIRPAGTEAQGEAAMVQESVPRSSPLTSGESEAIEELLISGELDEL